MCRLETPHSQRSPVQQLSLVVLSMLYARSLFLFSASSGRIGIRSVRRPEEYLPPLDDSAPKVKEADMSKNRCSRPLFCGEKIIVPNKKPESRVIASSEGNADEPVRGSILHSLPTVENGGRAGFEFDMTLGTHGSRLKFAPNTGGKFSCKADAM